MDYLWVLGIFLTSIVSFAYLADTFKQHIPATVYEFFTKYKDPLIGVYYAWLAYDLYVKRKS